ncbi:MAG: ABC transporter ATP-binding protein [Firmicutes bacterium HGW-Firmicutes-5]|nr:MAG: ABC transporter ATP-binding protein [Firmicutes bacterium HGW-Firmicutes-5]
MQLSLSSNNIDDYLEKTEIINYDAGNVIITARKLKDESKTEIELIKNTFEFVRDKVGHSADINGVHVTCKASDVLEYREGICYAKSHLLAALLRCNGIPSGFCYQKLILDDDTAKYLILHGLNAVYIKELGKWIRLDARGNKPGVEAEFSLEDEKLAFPIREEFGEVDIPVIFDKPDYNVIQALISYDTVTDMFNNLPRKLV